MKQLFIQSAFVIPNYIDFTDDELDMQMADSIHRFQAMSNHIPNLPNEFVIALVVKDKQMKPVSFVRAAWLKVKKESFNLINTESPIDFNNIEVVGIFVPSEFEVEVIDLTDNQKVCATIIIKNVQ